MPERHVFINSKAKYRYREPFRDMRKGFFYVHCRRMSLKRSLLKIAYPMYRMLAECFTTKNAAHLNKDRIKPVVSFYTLSATLNNGNKLSFEELKGKKVLIVNTASDCIYTAQYAELQQAHQVHGDQIAIIAFPANDFKEQEKGNDAEIAQFCAINYDVDFMIAKKSKVLGAHANDVFQWLTQPEKNGWNRQVPQWNFSKYLIDEHGVLVSYSGPAVSPLSIVKTALIH